MRHGTTDEAPLGYVLAGRYHLSAVIGTAGLARIYHATDQALGRSVAVKVLSPDVARDERLLARFQREATVGASFAHPNVVEIYDTGNDHGLHFIVMELAPGRTLEDLLREQAALPPAWAVEIAGRVCAALSAAHAHGLVHGDVKPANIILTGSGQVKMTEFGSGLAAAGAGLTTEDILATRPYCPPGQAMGEPAEPRSDIYSLGVVLHRMLTGALRHDAEAPGAHPRRSDGPRFLARNRAIPPSLQAVVERATAADPADRQQTARELRAELVRALRESGPARSGASNVLAADPAHTQATGFTRAPRASRSLPRPIRLAAVNALVAAAALVAVTGLTLQVTRASRCAEPRQRLEAVARSFEQGPARRATGPGRLADEARRWLGARSSPDDQVIAVRTGQGDVLTSSGGLDLREIPQVRTLLRSRESRWWSLTGDDTRFVGLTVPLVQDGRQVGTLVAVAGQARSAATWGLSCVAT
ncbi:MAG: protein kinase domain-containing protein [Carbonactinosporaceae bacterium]